MSLKPLTMLENKRVDFIFNADISLDLEDLTFPSEELIEKYKITNSLDVFKYNILLDKDFEISKKFDINNPDDLSYLLDRNIYSDAFEFITNPECLEKIKINYNNMYYPYFIIPYQLVNDDLFDGCSDIMIDDFNDYNISYLRKYDIESLIYKILLKTEQIPNYLNTDLELFEALKLQTSNKNLLLSFKINDPSYLYLIDEDPAFIIVLEELLTNELLIKLLDNIIEFDSTFTSSIKKQNEFLDKIEDIYERFDLLDLFYQETIHNMIEEDKKYLLEKALRLNNKEKINSLSSFSNREKLIEVSKNYPKLILYRELPYLILSRDHAIIFITERGITDNFASEIFKYLSYEEILSLYKGKITKEYYYKFKPKYKKSALN